VRVLYLLYQLARSEACGLNITVQFPANFGGGLLNLFREDIAGTPFEFLRGCLKFGDTRTQLTAKILNALLQRKLIQADHRQRRITVIQPNTVPGSHFACQPTFVE
jgi:hypothetical protein